jgi:site-specific recombinase XerC
MDPLDKVNPVKPPKVNKNKKPIPKAVGVITIRQLLHVPDNQLNILIPVGRAITEVAPVN